jgi:multidrug efflux pump subunit AcrB
VPSSQRAVSQSQFQQRLSRELRTYAGMRIQVVDMSQQILTAERSGGSPVVFTVRGPDWDTLVQLSNDLMTRMAESGVMIEPNTDVRVGMPELRIFPDRERCADLGTSFSGRIGKPVWSFACTTSGNDVSADFIVKDGKYYRTSQLN